MTTPRELADRLEKEMICHSGDALIDNRLLYAAADMLRALAEQQERDAKDAERYRWLRRDPSMLLHLKGSEFDAAIDAARTPEPKT